MAAGAGWICRSERSANMATLTAYVRMCTIEHEACAEVIECLLRPRNTRGKQAGDYSAEKERFFHCSDLTSVKDPAA